MQVFNENSQPKTVRIVMAGQDESQSGKRAQTTYSFRVAHDDVNHIKSLVAEEAVRIAKMTFDPLRPARRISFRFNGATGTDRITTSMTLGEMKAHVMRYLTNCEA